jgi:chromosome segregation ATPase
MDANALSRMIEWLDEERRRDRSRIAKLEETIATQQDAIEAMTRRLNTLESSQTEMRNQFLPVGRDNEIVEFLREEFKETVENLEGKRISSEREAERRADISREALLRPLRDLGERVDVLERTHDELGTARVERDRVGIALNALQQRVEDITKRFEDPEKRLSYLEEQRRQDARRILESQSEVPELRRQIDSLRQRSDLIENLAQRAERLAIDVQNNDTSRQQNQQAFMEQQALLSLQRDQRVEEIHRSFSQAEDEMRKRSERFEQWSETYRQMKRVVDDNERLGDRMERRLNEIQELVRISEDRIRQEWQGFTSDEDKRRQKFTSTNDETWRIHKREFDELRARVSDLANGFTPITDSLDRLWKFERGLVDLFRDKLNTLLIEHDQDAAGKRARTTQTMRPFDGSATGSFRVPDSGAGGKEG